MKVIFSSIIVIALALTLLMSFGLPLAEWFDVFDFGNADFIIMTLYTFAGIGVIGLIITLIVDRLKSKREEERNDYRKY